MNRNIKLLILLLAFAGALALPLCAQGAVIAVPDGVETVGEEAFYGLDAADGVVVPYSVKSIGERAFGDATIYGYADSYAASYARSNGLKFGALEITDALISADALWAAPGVPVTFTVNANSGYPDLKYRFYASIDGWSNKDSGEISSNTYTFTFDRSGAYKVWAEVYHNWYAERAELSANFMVPDPIRFAVSEARIAVGQSLRLISANETRQVTLISGNSALVEVDGHNVIGRALGTTVVTATVVTDLGVFSERFQVEVIVPVDAIVITPNVNKLQLGESVALTAQVLPWNATYSDVTWWSSDPNIVSVNEYGVATANAPGACLIIADAGGKRASVTMSCDLYVREIALSVDGQLPLPLYTNNSFKLNAMVTPWNASDSGVTWSSQNEAVATVDAQGVVTCVGAGAARIICEAADGAGAQAAYDINVLQGAEYVYISADRSIINLNETIALTADILPYNAPVRAITWTSSDDRIARVSADGVVTPVSLGNVFIIATAHNGVYTQYPLTVGLPSVPTSLTLNQTDTLYLAPGDTFTLIATAHPENSVQTVNWSSSSTSIARVDSNGRVTGVASGSATITVTSAADAKIVASVRVVVLSSTRVLVMPARKTSISAISSNLVKINDVLNSSTNELTSLLAQGKIDQGEFNARKSVIAAAFKMYAFPWMTLNTQPYWKAENSEGGAKDFQPGIVYYGIPYNSTYGALRYYNVTMLLNENRYYKSSNGSYYILNQNNLVNGKYCGNDCSAMIALAFGSRISTSITWRTTEFYSDSTYFKTISNPADLRPGDLMVRNGRHVVMFLYYASGAKSQVVVIEQGGTEAAINTVSTGLYNLSYYTSNSYKGRRLRAWS